MVLFPLTNMKSFHFWGAFFLVYVAAKFKVHHWRIGNCLHRVIFGRFHV